MAIWVGTTIRFGSKGSEASQSIVEIGESFHIQP